MQSTRIIALFTLKPGISSADYEAWAHRRDLPAVRALKSVDGFDVFCATGMLGGGAVPYDYIEIIDVADISRFHEDITHDPMPDIVAEFAAVADAVFIVTRRL